MINDCVVFVSKSGKNLNARIPDKFKEVIGRGDKVKITVLEKAPIKETTKILSMVKELINKPNGEKLKGNILGYPVDVPLAKLIKCIPKTKIEKLLCEAIAK